MKNARNKEERLPKQALWVGQLLLGSVAMLLLIATAIIFPRGAVAGQILFGIFGLTWLFFALVYLPLWYRSYRYIVTPLHVELSHGVFFWRKEWIKRDKIAFVRRIDTPITSVFGLTSLLLTASGAYLLLVCLDQTRADEMQQELRQEECE